jgi:hypothetical protein
MLFASSKWSITAAPLFLSALLDTAGARDDGLFVIDSGAIGIGTSVPVGDLEITDVTGNGFTGFRLNNQSFAGATWAFSAADNGSLQFNKIGSGGAEAAVNSRLDADGAATLVVQGSVAGTQFVNTSSREAKTDFQPLAVHDVLQALMRLPLTSWRYKHDPASTRHYGAVAEDFQAAFGLGDGRHISTVDAAGVTMAAVQALHQLLTEELARRDADIAALRGEKAVKTATVASGQDGVVGSNCDTTSSREGKHDFAALESREMPRKLDTSPVGSWRFEDDANQARHSYCVKAEDFQQAFGLGNGKTIATVDADGVTMAAIQGLHQAVKDKDAQLARNAQDIAALRDELAELKKLVRAFTSLSLAQ